MCAEWTQDIDSQTRSVDRWTAAMSSIRTRCMLCESSSSREQLPQGRLCHASIMRIPKDTIHRRRDEHE